jgi:neutral ceramidase
MEVWQKTDKEEKVSRYETIQASVLVGLCLTLVSCGTLRVRRVDPPPVTPPTTLQAGVGKVDITPPVGMPLFGYSIGRSQSSTGLRTRLYARAVYLEDTHGGRVALVQCDLGAISALLHRRVAQAVAPETGLSTDRLLLAATHTHAGPGGYFGAAFYNLWGANTPGFDKRLLAFLVERVALAVRQAYQSRQPARLAMAQEAFYGLTRNRSIEAYNNNQQRTDPGGAPPGLAPQLRAVDPTFTMLRIDRVTAAGTEPLGAFTNFAIHSNVLRPSNTRYSGDVHAAAERVLEWHIQQHYRVQHPVVHALTNGTEGDVQPTYAPQRGVAEANCIGQELGERAFAMFRSLDARLTDEVQIRHHYAEISLTQPSSLAGTSVCKEAMVGFPVVGGSEESESDLPNIIHHAREGEHRASPKGCQTWKRPAADLDFLPKLTHKDFPTQYTFQLIRINQLLLAAVPGEMTTEMGWRVKQAVLQAAQQTNQAVTQVAIVGLANQYVSYFTTPEEYDMQHYEGAATLFGPGSGPFIQAHLVQLVQQMADTTTQAVVPSSWEFRPGLRVSYFPHKTPRQIDPEAMQVEVFASQTPPRVQFQWQDGTPGSMPSARSLVRLETQNGNHNWVAYQRDGIPVDDQGLDIDLHYIGETEFAGVGIWQATWYPQTPPPAGRLRFAISARDTWPALYSVPFTLTSP